jgi:hypothetical protein
MMKGFLIDNGVYAAIPYVNGYLIIHNGQQLEKLCRTESSAKKYIADHKKSLTQGQLPIE